MENKKFLVYTVLFILSNILINNIEEFINQNNSKIHLQNFGQYNESSIAPFSILTQSESDDGNLAELVEFSISNSEGSIEFIPGIGYTSYIGGNLTVQFELIDGNISRNIIFDENNLASFQIKYNKSSGVNENGTLLNSINFYNNTKIYYGIIITSDLTEGTYVITIFINFLNYTFIPYTFGLTIKALTYMENILFSDPGGIIWGPKHNFFIGSNISIEFKLREMGVNISYVLDENNQATYQIIYNKTSGSKENETLSSQINFNNKTKKYSGILETSVLSEGNYTITINIDLLNITFVPRSFKFIVRKKYEVFMSINKPREIIGGEIFTVSILAQYGENPEFYFLENTNIKLTLYINDGESILRYNRRTNKNGKVSFSLILPIDTNKISLEVEVTSAWNHESLKLEITDIKIISSLNFIIILSFLLGLIIIIVIALILIYVRFIIPNKRRKIRIMNEYNQIFEDSSRIDCISIYFKKNGKSLYHKSYISNELSVEKFSKYTSSLSTFKKSEKSQNILSEIKYKDKILLLADGKYIRAILILNKKGSRVLKNSLKEFIDNFEDCYKNILENWQDNLIPYGEVEKLLEDKLNIFMVLPHKIKGDSIDSISQMKQDSRNLLKITKNLIKETGDNFFFISTLLTEFSKQTNKGIIKFFNCFNELRNQGIFDTIHES